MSDGEEGLDVERRGKDANKRLKDKREEVEAPNVIARWRDEDRWRVEDAQAEREIQIHIKLPAV